MGSGLAKMSSSRSIEPPPATAAPASAIEARRATPPPDRQGNRAKGATIDVSADFSAQPVESAPQAAASGVIGRQDAVESVHPIALSRPPA